MFKLYSVLVIKGFEKVLLINKLLMQKQISIRWIKLSIPEGIETYEKKELSVEKMWM